MTPKEALRTYFGYESFRGLQEQIIDSVLAGHDTLALLPTGGGKSLCFQIPTLVNETLCLVITPLIALMRDQVDNLRKRDIRAAAIYTGMSYDQQRVVLDNCQFGPYRFLYVSPERLESAEFRKRLGELPIGLVAVDEAHCVCEWGYDFRPSYLRIAQLWEHLPADKHVPILALTATATREVEEDIVAKLRVESRESSVESDSWNIFRQSFHRENLRYVVRNCVNSDEKLQQILRILQGVPGTGIIYVRNRKRSKELSEWLQSQGHSADFYHAGLDSAERARRQTEWKEGKTRVMVCTNAFGMGIDKPDVRFVVHYDLPDSIEAYFQEAGRAGRDGEKAYCVLLYAPEDNTKVHKRVSDNYPPEEFIEKVYDKMSDYLQVGEGSGLGHTFALHIDDFCHVMGLPVLQTYSALHLLSQAGWIAFDEERETQARVQIRVPRANLYEYNLSEEQDALLQDLMRRYTGIFTDLQYISDVQHELLVSLAQRGIVTYIPRTIACAVTYMRERQATVFVPASIYDERRAHYVTRLQSMLSYAQQGGEEFLLAYFGERSTHTA